MTTSKHQNPCPEIIKQNFTILVHCSFSWLSLLYSQFFSSMPEWREEDSKRNNAFSLNVLFGHALAQESPGGQL